MYTFLCYVKVLNLAPLALLGMLKVNFKIKLHININSNILDLKEWG